MALDGLPADLFCLDTAAQNLSYDPETGVIVYKRCVAKGWPYKPGSPAGRLTKSGYIRVVVGGRQVLAHRLAWAMFFGFKANGFIDHKDGIRTNNAISNLRIASKAANAQNRRMPNANNTSGFLGVTFRPRQGWTAQICVHGVTKIIGYYTAPEAAHAAYLVAKRELHEGNLL